MPDFTRAARGLASAMQTAIAAERGTIAWLFEFQFAGGTVRFATTPHDLTTTSPSATWQGIGGHMEYDFVQEGTDPSGYGVDVTLSGVDQTVINLLLSDKFANRKAKIYFAHLDDSGAVTTNPYPMFDGNMNGDFRWVERRTADGQGTVTITGRLSDDLSALGLVRGFLTNLESHQAVFAGDKFFEFVGTLNGRTLYWGNRPVRLGSRSAGWTHSTGDSPGAGVNLPNSPNIPPGGGRWNQPNMPGWGGSTYGVGG